MLHTDLFQLSLSAPATKSESAYRTISEVSEELDVPQHVLRFWESHFPKVKPSRMRGKRRYYRPQDVELLRKVKTLLYSQGYTIKGAKKAINVGIVHQPEKTSVAAAPDHKNTAKDMKPLIQELRLLKSMLNALA